MTTNAEEGSSQKLDKTALAPQPVDAPSKGDDPALEEAVSDDGAPEQAPYEEQFDVEYDRLRIRSTQDMTASAEARRERKKSHRRLAVAFLLIVALVAGATAFVTYGMELWGGRSVPDVINETETRARTELEERDFVVEVKQEVVDNGVGHVLSQSPTAGERHESGDKVTITVGVARTIPAVVGMSSEEAQQALKEAGVTNIKVEYEQAPDVLGSVLAISPEEGAAFTTGDTVVLTVASAYVLPDVVGKTESEATKELEAMGLSVTVTYVTSDKDGRTVLSMAPAAGTEVDSGTDVALEVADPYPSDVRALREYFDHKPSDIAEFLAKNNFTCNGGYVDGRGNAQAIYADGTRTIRLCSDPFDRNFDPNAGGGSEELLNSEASELNSTFVADAQQGNQGDVVAAGASFRGVRYEYGASEQPASAKAMSMEAVREIMKQCGLEGYRESCTESNIKLPAGHEKLASEDGRKFICADGVDDGYTWTVLIAQTAKDSSDVRVVVTYAPSDLYGYYDLSGNGNRVCDFVAYVDMYA